jgi:hypothetical protein
MATGTVEEVVVDEEIWRSWVQNGIRQERAAFQRLKLVGEIVLIMLAFGAASYRLGGG